jgi:ribosome-binding protein aMBF1 (putative translation factor)
MKLNELKKDAASRAQLLGTSEKQVELGDAAIALVEAVGTLLTEMREKEGVKQADLAEMIGLSGSGRISQFESGQLRHAINLKSLAKIAAVLGYDLIIEAKKTKDVKTIGIEVGVSDGGRTYHGKQSKLVAAE